MADLVVLARDKMAKNPRKSSGKRDSDERLVRQKLRAFLHVALFSQFQVTYVRTRERDMAAERDPIFRGTFHRGGEFSGLPCEPVYYEKRAKQATGTSTRFVYSPKYWHSL